MKNLFFVTLLMTLVMICGCVVPADLPLDLLPTGATAHKPDAENIELVSHFGGPALSIAHQGDGYVYLGFAAELAVLDVSEPAVPRRVNSLPMSTVDIQIDGDFTYVVGKEGLTVLDSSAPRNPTLVSHLAFAHSSLSILIARPYAYISVGFNGLHVVDISDPFVPTLVTTIDLSSRMERLALASKQLYMVGGNYINLLDITEPAAPRWIALYQEPLTFHSLLVNQELGYVYVGSTYRIDIIDMEATPALRNQGIEVANSVPMPGTIWDMAIQGHYLYAIMGDNVLAVLDTTSATPQIVGSLVLPGNAYRIAVFDTHAYVADIDGGLQVVNIADPTNPLAVGSYNTPGFITNVFASETHVFVVGDMDLRLHSLHMSEPTEPIDHGTCSPTRVVGEVTIAGNYLYEIERPETLHVIDISNPCQPVEVGSTEIPELNLLGSAVSGDFLYSAAYGGGLFVIDVTDPTEPRPIELEQGFAELQDVAVRHDIAYVTSALGLEYFNVSQPPTTQYVGVLHLPNPAEKIVIAGHYAYVTDDSSRLHVIDLADPVRPSRRGVFAFTHPIRDIAVRGDYLYSANGTAGVYVLDISNPDTPLFVGFYPTLGRAQGIDLIDDLIVVADSHGGLLILSFTPPND